jgi:hypothetical protein
MNITQRSFGRNARFFLQKASVCNKPVDLFL